MKKTDLIKIYNILRKHFGHRGWWPGDSPLEIVLGAILTQNTNWKNVEKAITNLKGAGLLNYAALRDIPTQNLAEQIRPSGYFNQKALKIKAFIHFVEESHAGSLEQMFQIDTETLREQLLGVRGIGPETADSILLYAGEHTKFVVDLYTYRITTRHAWLPEEVLYHEMQVFFEDRLPRDIELYKDYHAQLVAVGNHFCRKTPKCEECPLKSYLPKS